MKKFVKIGSTQTIQVTGGLQNVNTTNLRSSKDDRLNVKPMWMKLCCLIKAGTGYYPSELKTWSTVKSLEKAGILTIGEEVDTFEPKEELEKMTELKTQFVSAKEQYNKLIGQSKKVVTELEKNEMDNLAEEIEKVKSKEEI